MLAAYRSERRIVVQQIQRNGTWEFIRLGMDGAEKTRSDGREVAMEVLLLLHRNTSAVQLNQPLILLGI